MIQAGPISSGTLRPQDLIPVFFQVLEENNPEEAAEIKRDYSYWFDHPNPEEGYYDDLKLEDIANDLLDELFTALADIAPDNLYFGTAEGDGAEFGFWYCEDEYGEEV